MARALCGGVLYALFWWGQGDITILIHNKKFLRSKFEC